MTSEPLSPTEIISLYPHTFDGLGSIHQYQGAGTNNCGPTSLTIAINLLLLRDGYTTEPQSLSYQQLSDAMQADSRWLGLRGYRITRNFFGFPVKGATFAKSGMLKAFQDFNETWIASGHPSLGHGEFRNGGTKAQLIDNLRRGRVISVRWVWEKPLKNGAHWVTVIGFNPADDEFYVLNSALPHRAIARENVQRVPWVTFNDWWCRPFLFTRNQMLTFGQDRIAHRLNG